MMKTVSSAILFASALVFVANLGASGDWGPWPDLRFVPSNPAGWSLERLNKSWSPVLSEELEADGVYLRVRQGKPRLLREGEAVGVYLRSFDGSTQGLVGRGEVQEASKTTGEARVKVAARHLVQYFDHDPWKGWSLKRSWRPGFAPGETSYFVSPLNLGALPEEEWKSLLSGEIYRGMSARNLLRTLGSPAARGAYDYSTGRQEQWVYSRDPERRTYVYVDVASQRVTAFHRGP